jgi:hypothetical protein
MCVMRRERPSCLDRCYEGAYLEQDILLLGRMLLQRVGLSGLVWFCLCCGAKLHIKRFERTFGGGDTRQTMISSRGDRRADWSLSSRTWLEE